MTKNSQLNVPENWWDGRITDSFFPSVYYEGDQSEEGFLNRTPLPPQARTIRECDLLEKEFHKLNPNLDKASFQILDCPCGTGRHSIELAKSGYKVVGVDLCPNAISTAKSSLTAENAEVRSRCQFVQGDMRSLRGFNDEFDAVINMFFSFGFFTESGNHKTLQEFFRVMKSGGLLAIHTDVNPHLIEQGTYGDREIRQLGEQRILRVQESWNSLAERLEGSWTIVEPGGQERNASYSVRIYSTTEMHSMLTSEGFQFIHENPVPIFCEEISARESQELLYTAIKP